MVAPTGNPQPQFESLTVSTLSFRFPGRPQPIKIFNGTLLDNICLSNSLEEGEAVVQFCQEFGFHAYFMKLPQNYLTLVGEEGINLSGGQQQLVGLARGLVPSPSIALAGRSYLRARPPYRAICAESVQAY